MICPVCGSEMKEGGLISDGARMGWVPAEQLSRKGLKKLVVSDFHPVGEWNYSIGQTKVENAWLCEKCHKVIGIFDTSASGDTVDFMIRRR